MLQQVLPRGFEFVTDHLQPEQPGAEGVFLIAVMGSGWLRAFLLQRVFSKGTIEFRLFNSTLHAKKIKAYIQLRLAISHHTVQVEGVVSGAIVMITLPVGSVIPELFQLLHGAGALPVHIVKEPGIRFWQWFSRDTFT